MARTKAQVRTAVQQLIDDGDAKWWSTANLDLVIDLAYDDRWAEILQFAPRALSQLDTLTSLTSPGYINVASGGDATKRFFRVQSIVRDGQEYSPIDPRWVVVENSAVVAVSGGNAFKYYKQDSRIWLFPFDTTTDVEFRYSYLPPSFNGLADGTAITWPDGGEGALIYEAAGRAMMRGGQEVEAGKNFLALGNRIMRETVIPMMERSHAGPFVMTPADTAESWGSE